MNKRKVLSILLLALITVALAVSCSSNIETPVTNTEELAYVTFGNGHSRELGTSYLTEDYNRLYWFYTAAKADQYGTTGVTSAETPVSKSGDDHVPGLAGQVGPFSQGAWKFKLYAYKEPSRATLVYESDDVPVTLKGGDVKNVPVSVNLQGDFGALNFADAHFAWYKKSDNQTVGTGDVYLRINIKGTADKDSAPIDVTKIEKVITPNYKLPTYIDFGYGGSGKFPAGYYTCTVKAYVAEDLNLERTDVNEGSTYKASQEFGLRVYGNATTKIMGDLTEGLFAEVIFDVAKQDMKVFVPSSTSSTKIENINVVPDATAVEGVEKKSTTVEFERGALTSVADKTLQLDVKVTTVEAANNKFNISGTTSDNKSAFAGIDVTLWATDTTGTNEVNNFTDNKFATVTTYIAKGLSGVVVKYNGTDGKSDPIATDDSAAPDKTVAAILSESSPSTALGYNPSTGLLRFKTNHFSEYYVLAVCEAINVTTNVGYATLSGALSSANNNEVIALVSNVSINEDILLGSGNYITLDLSGYNIECGNNSIILAACSNFEGGTLKLTGSGSVKGSLDRNSNNTDWVAWTFRLYGNETDNRKKCNLIIDKNVIVDSPYAISMLSNGSDFSYGMNVDIKGKVTGPQPIYVNGSILGYSGEKKVNDNNLSGEPSNDIPTINIYDDAVIECSYGEGIYLAGYVKTNIYKARLTSDKNVISIASGELTINGATINGGNDFSFDAGGGGSITFDESSAIYVKQHTPNPPITVTINDGIFTGAIPFYQAEGQNGDSAKPDKVSLAINGGSFTSTYNGTNENAVAIKSDDKIGFITGGTFSTKPYDDYIYDDCCAEENSEGKYQVKEVVALVEVDSTTTKYSSLWKALDAAVDNPNATVNLLSDLDFEGNNWTPFVVPASVSLTINGNGHTIKNVEIDHYLKDADGTWVGGVGSGSQATYMCAFIGNNLGSLTINDLNFSNFNVDMNVGETPVSQGSSQVGVVLGANNGTKAEFNNVNVSDSVVKGYTKVGVICGHDQSQKIKIKHTSITKCEVVLEADGTDPDAALSGIIIGYGAKKESTNGIKLENNKMTIDESVKWNGYTRLTSSDGTIKAGSWGLMSATYSTNGYGGNSVKFVEYVDGYGYETAEQAADARL